MTNSFPWSFRMKTLEERLTGLQRSKLGMNEFSYTPCATEIRQSGFLVNDLGARAATLLPGRRKNDLRRGSGFLGILSGSCGHFGSFLTDAFQCLASDQDRFPDIHRNRCREVFEFVWREVTHFMPLLVGCGFLRTQTTLAGIFGNAKRPITRKPETFLGYSFTHAQKWINNRPGYATRTALKKHNHECLKTAM